MKQEHRFFISATENTIQFALNLCIICTQSVNVFENAIEYKENQLINTSGLSVYSVWILKVVLFNVKAFLSMFSSFKALSDNIILESKLKFKREPDCGLMFIKLFNYALLIINLAANLSLPYIADDIGEVNTINIIYSMQPK